MYKTVKLVNCHHEVFMIMIIINLCIYTCIHNLILKYWENVKELLAHNKYGVLFYEDVHCRLKFDLNRDLKLEMLIKKSVILGKF